MKKILLIGDSIRMGYDKYVKMSLEEVAEVKYPEENCRFTTYVIRQMIEWKNRLYPDGDVDLVHINAGLWDTLRMEDGEMLLTIEEYERNMDRIFKLLKLYFPAAKLVFATSTPVIERLFGVLKRRNSDVEAYNAVAKRVATSYGAVINDLYSLMAAAPEEYHSDLTHYYSKEGTRLITDQVLSTIEGVLDIKGKTLDYDALFGETKDIVGI